MSADCVPILLCDSAGLTCAGIHGGWKSLAQGIIEATIAALGQPQGHWLAWIGPSIGPQHFEVGSDVIATFSQRYPHAEQFFTMKDQDHWLGDLWSFAEMQLQKMGVINVTKSNLCTYELNSTFFSHRRNQASGRMASLIWRTE